MKALLIGLILGIELVGGLDALLGGTGEYVLLALWTVPAWFVIAMDR